MSPRDNFRAYISNRERERRREIAAAATARQREGSGEGEGDRFSRACRDYASANSGKHTIVACSIGSPFSISGCARRVLPLHATLRRTLRFLAVHARARARALRFHCRRDRHACVTGVRDITRAGFAGDTHAVVPSSSARFRVRARNGRNPGRGINGSDEKSLRCREELRAIILS